jgi:polyferredoxin
MVSSVQIVNIFFLRFPSFEQSPLWYMLIGLTLLSTLLFGMVFCGSLCPFAAVEEFLYNLVHRKKKIPERRLSYARDQKARYVKYAVLFTIICASAVLGSSNAAGIEPFLTLFTLNGTWLAWGLLAFMLFLAFFHFRFWCKYLCPVGACLGLLARFSLYKIRLGENCSGCAACDKICPTRAIRMDKAGLPKIDHPECILCGKCINVCPKEKQNKEDEKWSPTGKPVGRNLAEALAKADKSFIILLVIAALIVFGVITENVRPAIRPAAVETEITVDTNEVKSKIQRAGIVPREAMHWKEL